MGTQKNRLNETVLLSTQNICYKLWVRIYLQFYAGIFCLSKPVHTSYLLYSLCSKILNNFLFLFFRSSLIQVYAVCLGCLGRQLVFQILERLSYIRYRPFVCFVALPPSQQFFSHDGMNIPFVLFRTQEGQCGLRFLTWVFLQSRGLKLISLSLQILKSMLGKLSPFSLLAVMFINRAYIWKTCLQWAIKYIKLFQFSSSSLSFVKNHGTKNYLNWQRKKNN